MRFFRNSIVSTRRSRLVPNYFLITQADGLLYHMSLIFTSASCGAGVYVLSEDHCPPHVHARHRREDWVARVRFSFIHDEVELMSAAPDKYAPPSRVLDRLLGEIKARLIDCRKTWWSIRQSTCLANQWAIVRAPGRVDLTTNRTTPARQISDCRYDPITALARVSFRDGTIEDVKL
jgi:hypothetical protein